MAPCSLKFLPLRAEINAAAKEAHELWAKTCYPLWSSVEDDGDAIISLECVDFETASSAAASLDRFQEGRSHLTYRFQYFGSDKQSTNIHDVDSEYNKFVWIHIDDYIPGEFSKILGYILWAAAHYYPISLELFSSMKLFVEAFGSFDILSISLPSNGETPDPRDIVTLHKSLLKVARLLVTTILDYKPVRIEIDGAVKHLSVSVDKTPVKLSPTQVRGVAALALLEYDHWFSVDDFCQLAFPGDTYEPRKQFDAALSVLKQFPPFSWDADEGIRRIKGAVINSVIDEAVLQAHLKQKRGS